MFLTNVIDWLSNHWADLLAALGVGGGSGVLGQKLTRKKELNDVINLRGKVENIESDFNKMDRDIKSLKTEIHLNTAFDKQFRAEVEKQHVDFKEDMKEVKGRLDQILQHLLNNK